MFYINEDKGIILNLAVCGSIKKNFDKRYADPSTYQILYSDGVIHAEIDFNTATERDSEFDKILKLVLGV